VIRHGRRATLSASLASAFPDSCRPPANSEEAHR
jgi:hypothetical protein